MTIEKNYNLSRFNTFGVSAIAKLFAEVKKEEDLKELFRTPEFLTNARLFLGGGSNVLFTKNFDGIVVLNKIKGIEILKDAPDYVLVRAMSGEVWHDLVSFTSARGYWGIENLAYIPGTVGGAPVQNIGAYGAELKDVLESVEAYDVVTAEKRVFSKAECKFGYRDSVFKGELRGKYFISAITLRLSKKGEKNVSYKILKEYLERKNINVQSPQDISNAVISIRKEKLPDPTFIGNAGSFFKNIFIPEQDGQLFQYLLKRYPEMPYFKENMPGAREEAAFKIPAGWLIEQCGWKGKRVGNVGVHERQALVLVNYGGATGGEVKNLADKIMSDVYQKFGLQLEPEVNLI